MRTESYGESSPTVTLTYDDGSGFRVTLTKQNAETVHDMIYAFEQFMRAADFSYVEQIGVKYDNGNEHWSGF